MSDHGQSTIPAVGVTPSNHVWIAREDSWAATRFALVRAKRKEGSLPPGKARTAFLYELATLDMEGCHRLIAFFNANAIEYEVI